MAKKGMVYTTDGSLSVKTFDDSYKFISTHVDGYIERIPLSVFDERHIDVWINEEGKFRSDLRPSAVLMYNGKIHDVLIGNIVFTKTNKNGHTITLTDKDVDFITKTLDSVPYSVNLADGHALPMLSY